MALWFDLYVNDEKIGFFSATRREHTIPDHGWCTYDVAVRRADSLITSVVRHRYDAGAFALVAVALAAGEGK